MRISRLYIDRALQLNDEIQLDKEQSHYLATVLRLRVGDSVCLFNGEDAEYFAEIFSISKKQTILVVNNKQERHRESPLIITIGIGVSRGQHMDFAIQKVVELGVSNIVPVMTEFSNVKLQVDRLENKLQHWQQIIINACEQSQRTRVPSLSAPLMFNDFVVDQSADIKLIFHPVAEHGLHSIQSQPATVCLLLGSEGGFSDTEVNLARQNGFRLVQSGPRILRAETAVVTAMTLCQYQWGDL